MIEIHRIACFPQLQGGTHVGNWRINIATEAGPELSAALAGYRRVYAQSWKPTEPCPGFILGMVALAAERGWLRLGVLWLNDEPLAAQLWLTGGGKANIYKLAYVKGMEKLSAGSVLTQALMQHAMDVDRVAEVDYLSGDDAYKADWMSLRRERVGLEAFDPRRPAGLLLAARHLLRRPYAALKRLRAGRGSRFG